MNCLFCLINKEPSRCTKPEDEVIDQTTHFYAKPALGHFIEGYTLINTREHIRSFSYLCINCLQHLEIFKRSVCSKLQQIYQAPILVFEHGGVNPKYPAGCCIDHAHLHLLPINIDVYDYLASLFPHERIFNLESLIKYRSERSSYIYYESTSAGKNVFRINGLLPSQFLRRILCEKLGEPDTWDWAAYPFRDKINSFKNNYYQYSGDLPFSLEEPTVCVSCALHELA